MPCGTIGLGQVRIDHSKRLIQADGMNLTCLNGGWRMADGGWRMADGGCFKQISKEAFMIIRRTQAAC